MRNIKFILNAFLGIVLVLFSCSLRSYVEIIVENNTEYDVLIDGFYEGERIETISINSYDSYINSQYISPEEALDEQLFKEYEIDSVNIIFNNEKIIVQSCEKDLLQSCCYVEKNILEFGVSYEYEDLGHKKNRYTYTLSEEDYERAVFIDSLENR